MKRITLSIFVIILLVSVNISNAEETNVSQEDCMQLCMSRMNQCWGENPQAKTFCEENYCYAPISAESRDCFRDTPCETIGSSIEHKITICGMSKKP